MPFLQNLLFLRNGHGVKCFGHLEKGRLNLPVTEPVAVGLILLALFGLITSDSLLLFTGSAFEAPSWSFEPLSWSFTMNTDSLRISDSSIGVVLVDYLENTDNISGKHGQHGHGQYAKSNPNCNPNPNPDYYFT